MAASSPDHRAEACCQGPSRPDHRALDLSLVRLPWLEGGSREGVPSEMCLQRNAVLRPRPVQGRGAADIGGKVGLKLLITVKANHVAVRSLRLLLASCPRATVEVRASVQLVSGVERCVPIYGQEPSSANSLSKRCDLAFSP